MVTASIAVIGLGFVVAVSASSRPGQAEEPWLDLNFDADIDMTRVMGWIVMIAAVVGAVLFALALREAKPTDERRGRSVLGILIGLALFVLLLRWLRPFAASILEDGGEASETIVEPAVATGGGSLGWIFSILVAAVVAAALTRIGLSIRSTNPPFEDIDVAASATSSVPSQPAPPRGVLLGDDPRSTVLNAYGSFEDAAAQHGSYRLVAETETNHSHRAAQELDLEASDVDSLLRHQTDARYGDDEPTSDNATDAQAIAHRLVEGMDG
jgi:hypothetical protein